MHPRRFAKSKKTKRSSWGVAEKTFHRVRDMGFGFLHLPIFNNSKKIKLNLLFRPNKKPYSMRRERGREMGSHGLHTWLQRSEVKGAHLVRVGGLHMAPPPPPYVPPRPLPFLSSASQMSCKRKLHMLSKN